MQKEEFINKWLAQLRVADNHILPSMNIKERDIAMLLCQVVQIIFNCSSFYRKARRMASVVSTIRCFGKSNGEASIHINAACSLYRSIADIGSTWSAVCIAMQNAIRICNGNHIQGPISCPGLAGAAFHFLN